MPQALRIAIPPLGNEAVSIVKNTSLAMAIGVAEMTYQYKHIDNFAFRGTEALAAVTVLYVAICLALSALTARLGHRLSRHFAALSAPAIFKYASWTSAVGSSVWSRRCERNIRPAMRRMSS